MADDPQPPTDTLVPQLESERLRLSEIRPRDAEGVLAIFGSARAMEFYDLEPLTELEQAQGLIASWGERVAQGHGIRWGIRSKETGGLIGTCGFNRWSSRMKHATIGYDLRESEWGRGYAAEAVSRILEAGFGGELACGALHRVQADTVPGNQRSEALLRKLGFEEEGVRRQAGYWKEAFYDLKCFGLLRPDFRPVGRGGQA